MTAPRCLLLTGVTRGIGRALVDRFVEAGHVVHGCGRSAAALAELRELYPAPHSFRELDVSDAAQVERWAAELASAGQRPDLILNNAALINESAPLWEVSAEEFDRLLAVNVSGVANVVRAFTPALIDAGRGLIANMSSGWGRSTSPEVGPYCASKFAVEALSASLAQELPAGLACVAVSPGVVDTQMLRKCLPETAATCDDPETWSRRAAPELLALGPNDNGRSLNIG